MSHHTQGNQAAVALPIYQSHVYLQCLH